MDSQDLLSRFRAHLDASGLFDPPGRVLVAVSGGADSLALLHLLRAVATERRLALHVGHVDHGVHEASGAWAAAVRAEADRLAMPCDVECLALGPDASETTARTGRYRALRRMQEARDATYLATAHHATDQAETVLLRFLRGSGPAGLAGIPALGPAGLRRPLLPFTRDELRAWLSAVEPALRPVEDPANVDPRHDRAWIRAELLPEIRERFPDVDRALRVGSRQAAANRSAWDSFVVADPALGLASRAGAVEVEREPFAGYDNMLSEAVLRAVCRVAGCRPRGGRVRALAVFAREAPSGRRLDLGDGWRAETAFTRLRLVGPAPEGPTGGAVPVSRWGETDEGETRWGEWGITWRREAAGRVTRRSWNTWVREDGGDVRGLDRGDVIRPLGGTGSRPVRRLLMEARISRGERARYPLIVHDGRVLWVPGVCRGTETVPRPGEPALRLDVRRLGSS